MSFGLNRAVAALATACAVWCAASPAPAAGLAAKEVSCTLILDMETGETLVREGICGRRLPPASTFKVPLAVIGFDSGILSGERAPVWPYRPEYDAPKRDRKDVDPTIWERDSVLWYSREITRRLGAPRFEAYVGKLGYGNGDVSGDEGKGNSLTHSWLDSSLQISAEEQAGFVRRLLRDELPVSPRAMALTRAVLPQFEAADGWRVHGKTGTTRLRAVQGRVLVGWFVGWADGNGRRVVFARVAVGGATGEPKGPVERAKFLEALPGLMSAR